MKSWKSMTIVGASVGFITLNLYLVLKEDSKITQSIFVEDWTRVKKTDITEKFSTEGVVTSQEEYSVYFNKKDSEFQSFLVNEGDEISAGSPLFEYITPERDTLKQQLEADIQLAEGQEAAIEGYINELTTYQATIPSAPTAAERDAAIEQELSLDENASSALIVSTIQQEILKQELEQKKLDEEINKLNNQLSMLNEETDLVMEVSEVDGIVKTVNKKLENPLIEIASSTLSIEGAFTVPEAIEAEVGMRIILEPEYGHEEVQGEIASISTYPKENPTVNDDSTYRFTANMDEEPEAMMIGSKGVVSVITDEVKDVPAVSEEAIHAKKDPYIYRLTEGKVNKRKVKTGLGFEGIQEISDGIEVGDVILLSPKKNLKKDSFFITKLQPEKIHSSSFRELSKQEKFLNFFKGLLEK